MEELKLENKKAIMQQFFENVGGSRLLDWLEEVGYYTAPASMKHHASYEGSLFDHSLQVTHELIMRSGSEIQPGRKAGMCGKVYPGSRQTDKERK